MDIGAEIQSAVPSLMARIKQEALDRIEREAVNEATRVAVDVARQWAIENLAPEIKAQLEAGKAGMVAAAHQAAEGIGEAVKDALIASATKQLQSSWNVKKVVDGLFA